MEEVSKTQGIRFVDIVFIGPLMIYAGQYGKLPKFAKYSLIATGVATIIYNAKNFVKQERKL